MEAARRTTINDDRIAHLIESHERDRRPAMELLWRYYRNPMRRPAPDRARRLAQEDGLPDRLTSIDAQGQRREIVIENDIGWRVHTMVDFMFGRPITIVSRARDEGLRREIQRVLDDVWEASGGIGLLQDIGLLGHVYGYVDLLVTASGGPVGIEVIEPTRGIPIVSEHDYRTLDGYVINFRRGGTGAAGTGARARPGCRGGGWSGVGAFFGRGRTEPGPRPPAPSPVDVTHVYTPDGWRRYEDRAGTRVLVGAGFNDVSAGRVPIVHIQNVAQPFAYAGISEVEALIPLQDELNTRLSDRANRVTMQSFKMYLAKGLSGFEQVSVGPGRIWSTDNPDAQVSAFGGDASSPSEDAHIEQIREAMDKISGVPPVASGVVRSKIGNLTSENALRVTMMGLLSKTARKRIAYGRGIGEASRMVLGALDASGQLRTDPEDRNVRIEWPDPLPRDERELLEAAKHKVELGVARERVLGEIGYAPADEGVT